MVNSKIMPDSLYTRIPSNSTKNIVSHAVKRTEIDKGNSFPNLLSIINRLSSDGLWIPLLVIFYF